MTGLGCVSVYRSPRGDCTNGGESSKFDSVKLIPAESVTPETEGEDTFVVQIINPGGYGEFPVAIPLNKYKQTQHYQGEDRSGHVWVMFGGNFVYSSDSRFANQWGSRPIKIHDRVE